MSRLLNAPAEQIRRSGELFQVLSLAHWLLTRSVRSERATVAASDQTQIKGDRSPGFLVNCGSDHAGELNGEVVSAIDRGMSASDLGGLIHVYPTISTSIQQLGGRAAVEQALK